MSSHSQRPQSASQTQYSAPTSPFKLRPVQKMSIAQTYFLAHKARAKLSSEAARPDHNLRLLVGHANLLDSLMLDLAEAEREQELWFHQSVRGASSTPAEERHVQWADNVAVEEPEHDWRAEDVESSDSDSDSDDSFDEEDDDEDIEMADAISLRRIPSHPNKSFQHHYNDEEDFDMDDEEDYEQLSLQRISSHSNTSPSSPPELDSDSDESTEDEPMPPSPPTTAMPTFEDTKSSQNTPPSPTSVDKDSFYEEGYYLPPRNSARLVTAISVY
ncbi:protein ECM13 [Cladorrhinum sp. PSN259]|nr:protein ECM13 [Cladorrhinum sp. PSN259]